MPGSGQSLAPPLDAPEIPQAPQGQTLEAPPIRQPEEAPKDEGAGGARAGILKFAGNFLQSWMGQINKSVQQKQVSANQDVANAHATLMSSWANWSRVASNPQIPTIQKKLQAQAQVGSALQPILTKFMSGQQLSDDEQKQMQDLQQHALAPDEQAILSQYQTAKSSYLGAVSAFSGTAKKYMVPDQPQNGGGLKAVAKNVGKAVTGGGAPQFISSAYLQGIDGLSKLTPPMADPRTQIEQKQLEEFDAQAGTRKGAADLAAQEVDLRTKLSKAVADPNVSIDEVNRLSDQLHAVQGNLRTPSEKLSDSLANTGISALSKVNNGTPVSQLSPAERSFYEKTFPKDVPNNMFDFFMHRAQSGEQVKDVKTGQMRAYTTDDALADNAKWEGRMHAIERGPNATQELIGELNTLAGTIFPGASSADKAKWVAERLRPSPTDKEDAKADKPIPPAEASRLTQSSLYSVYQAHPELQYLVEHDPKAGYKMAAAPDTGSHWFKKDDHQDVEGDRQKLMTAFAQELQKRGAPSSFIRETTGVNPEPGQQLTPPPTGQPAATQGAQQDSGIKYRNGVPYKFDDKSRQWQRVKTPVAPPTAQLTPPPAGPGGQ